MERCTSLHTPTVHFMAHAPLDPLKSHRTPPSLDLGGPAAWRGTSEVVPCWRLKTHHRAAQGHWVFCGWLLPLVDGCFLSFSYSCLLAFFVDCPFMWCLASSAACLSARKMSSKAARVPSDSRRFSDLPRVQNARRGVGAQGHGQQRAVSVAQDIVSGSGCAAACRCAAAR